MLEFCNMIGDAVSEFILVSWKDLVYIYSALDYFDEDRLLCVVYFTEEVFEANR